jgi:L-fucose isomerase-like protein
MQVDHIYHLPIDRSELACIPELVNEKEAWAKFEEGLKDAESFDDAVAWVKKNKKIVEKLTMMAMIRRFNEDISRANKTWRN